MTHKQKINYMRIAASLCNFGFTKKQMDLLVSLYDLVIEKEGKTDVDSITEVEMEVENRDKCDLPI